MLEMFVLAWTLGMSVYAFFKIGAVPGVMLLAAFLAYLGGIMVRSQGESYELLSLVFKLVGVALMVATVIKYFSKKGQQSA